MDYQYHVNILHANISFLALKRHQLLRQQLSYQTPRCMEQEKKERRAKKNLEEAMNGPERRRQVVGQKTQERCIKGVKLGRKN